MRARGSQCLLLAKTESICLSLNMACARERESSRGARISPHPQLGITPSLPQIVFDNADERIKGKILRSPPLTRSATATAARAFMAENPDVPDEREGEGERVAFYGSAERRLSV